MSEDYNRIVKAIAYFEKVNEGELGRHGKAVKVFVVLVKRWLKEYDNLLAKLGEQLFQ